jgi:hypothetical protein
MFFPSRKKQEAQQVIELLTNIRNLQLRQLERLEEIERLQRSQCQYQYEISGKVGPYGLGSKLESFKKEIVQSLNDLRFR